MSNWKTKTSVFARKSVTREINGTSWNFYPVSLNRVFGLRGTITNITAAMSSLFAKNGDDVGQEIERIRQPEGTIERTKIDGITPQLADLRSKQRRDAIRESVEALLGTENKLAIGRLLADSLREDFAQDCPDAEIEGFMAELDLSDLIEFIMGFAEANAKVFGPLGERMKAELRSRLEGLRSVEGQPAPGTPES